MKPTTVKVTLSYSAPLTSDKSAAPYRLEKLVGDISVQPISQVRHVGSFLTEAEAKQLVNDRRLEVTVNPRKE